MLKGRKQCIQARKDKVRMVVGEDVRVEKNPDFWGKAVVGPFSGKIVHPKSLRIWLEENWLHVIHFYLDFNVLAVIFSMNYGSCIFFKFFV
jgi:hypothetical protein